MDSLNQSGAWKDSAWPIMVGQCLCSQSLTVPILLSQSRCVSSQSQTFLANRSVTRSLSASHGHGICPTFCSANHGTACVLSTNHKPGLSPLGQSWCDLCPLNQSCHLACAPPATCPRAACILPACAACTLPSPCSLAASCPRPPLAACPHPACRRCPLPSQAPHPPLFCRRTWTWVTR